MNSYRHILVKNWRIHSTDPIGEAWATSGAVSVLVHEALSNNHGSGFAVPPDAKESQ